MAVACCTSDYSKKHHRSKLESVYEMGTEKQDYRTFTFHRVLKALPAGAGDKARRHRLSPQEAHIRWSWEVSLKHHRALTSFLFSSAWSLSNQFSVIWPKHRSATNLPRQLPSPQLVSPPGNLAGKLDLWRSASGVPLLKLWEAVLFVNLFFFFLTHWNKKILN